MQQLRNQLEEAQSNGVAVGHFNISDWILFKAVCSAAQELKVPVIVGASEGERAFLGVAQIAALVKSLREEQGVPIFLNADHTHSLETQWRPPKPASIRSCTTYPHCRLRKCQANQASGGSA